MKKITVLLIALGFLSTYAFAAPKEGKGPAQGKSEDAATERVGNEIADTVADVLTGKEKKTTTTTGAMPPGLAKKGKTPPGLEGKTPPGWGKGKKKGWTEKTTTESESPLRRFIKNLFQKGQQ